MEARYSPYTAHGTFSAVSTSFSFSRSAAPIAEASSEAFVSAIIVSAAVPAAADTGLALNVPGCAIFSRPVRFGDLEVEQVENVLAAGTACARQAAGNDLREAGQVGAHAERHLRPALVARKPVTTSSKISRAPYFAVSSRSSCSESAPSGTWPKDEPVGSIDHACDVAIAGERRAHAASISPGFSKHRLFRHARQHARCRRAVEVVGVARGHLVVPAVEMALEAQQRLAAGERAGEAHAPSTLPRCRRR